MDECDMSDQRIEESISDGINEASRAVASMPQGKPVQQGPQESKHQVLRRDIRD